MTTTSSDRRFLRSNSRAEALGYLLDACRARASVEALVVSDADGLVIAASAARHVDPHMIAAVLPDPSRMEGCQLVTSRPFSFENTTLYLGVVGAGPRALTSVPHAIEGAQRILAAA